MADTLAQALQPDWVSADALYDEYKPVLNMVRELIGVIPNCNPILEIWPPAFRTFNLLVPNLLNLPAALFGQGAPKDLVGIAMYVSSSTAGCPYCTAHHCSFAIRRGANPDAVLGDRNPVEAAVADLAQAMALVPSTVTKAHVDAVEAHLSREHVDWIVMAVGLGGFLNQFMDTMGIQLEASAISDVQALLRPTGWAPGKHFWSTDNVSYAGEGRPLTPSLSTASPTSTSASTSTSTSRSAPAWSESDTSASIPVDGLGTYLRVIRQAPGAVRLERGWTKGVSGRIAPALLMLEDEVGYAFPILAGINSAKVVRAFATALRDNLDPSLSAGGLKKKLMAGLVYAAHVQDEMLVAEQTMLIQRLAPRVGPRLTAELKAFGRASMFEAVVPQGLSADEAAAVLLARSASPSPASVNEITVSVATDSLSSAEIVEIVIWLAVLQGLHRIYTVYDARLLGDDPSVEAVADDLGLGLDDESVSADATLA